MKNMTVSTLKNKDSFALQKGGGANLFSVPPLPPHGHKKFVVPSSIVAFKFQTRPYSTNERVNDESSAIRTTLYLYITNSRVDTSRHRVCTNHGLPPCICLVARGPSRAPTSFGVWGGGHHCYPRVAWLNRRGHAQRCWPSRRNRPAERQQELGAKNRASARRVSR